MVNKKNKKKFSVLFLPGKRGWLKIAEAFIAILLIITTVLMVVNREEIGNEDFSEGVYKDELFVLEEIRLNDTLREEILSVSAGSIPLEWSNFDILLSSVKEKINSEIPYYMECKAKLCKINSSCLLDNSIEEDIYTKSVIIFSNLNRYAPRKLKLFCWEI